LRAANPFVISYRQQSKKLSANESFTGSLRITAENLAKACARYADDKKAEDTVVLDLQGISSFTDYFVICSGTSEPHLKAIAGEIEERLRDEHGVRAVSVDGFPASQWIVLDYMQVIVHVFRREKREFYSLEDLWGDAPRIAWEPAETGARPTSA
jgi:ribosome-associated protein